MRLGLHAVGIGKGARPEVIAAMAEGAEQAGFSTIWAGEHVVLFDELTTPYPYSDDGRMNVPTRSDWLDPLIALAFAAGATERIMLATGVMLLPEHNPVIVAKQAASIDKLSGGRFALGVGVGWSRQEFAAVGVPFERRAARTAEYVAAMRTLWREDVATFAGEFVSFTAARMYPKPVNGTIPIIVGGNSDIALARTARWGDGWYAFNLRDAEEAVERATALRARLRAAGRDPDGIEIAVNVGRLDPSELPALEDAGVTQLVLLGGPPADPVAARAWPLELAARWRP